MGKDFRGNCDSQGKLGMCPSLAKPDWGGFPKRSVSNHKPQATKKFFGAAILQKCCRGVGEQPTFAKQMKLHNQMQQKSKSKSEESQLPLKLEGSNGGKGFRGNCDF